MFTRKNAILLLCVIGIGISSYLSYAKLTSTDLNCGTSSDCSAVQNSEYSTLLGIPVGMWGMAYYFSLFAIFYIEGFSKIHLIRTIAIFWGLVFSTFLTYLEAFVISAYCIWCLASFFNIILLALLHLSARKPKLTD